MYFGDRFFCFERKFSFLNDEQNGRICPKRHSNINKKDAQTTVWTSASSVPNEEDTRTCPQMILSISYVRDGGGMQEPCVRSVWTYARGSRACYGACAQMVGMFSSLYLFFIFSYFSSFLNTVFTKRTAKVVFFNQSAKVFCVFCQTF